MFNSGSGKMTTRTSEDFSATIDRWFVGALVISIPTMPFWRYGLGAFEIPMAIPIIALYSVVKVWSLLNSHEGLEITLQISFLLILLFMWSTASILWAHSGDMALRRWLSQGYQIYFTLFVINFCKLSSSGIFRFSRFWTMAVLIPVAIGFYGFFTFPEVEHFQFSYEYPRVLGDRNSDTFMALTVFPLALSLTFGQGLHHSWRALGLTATAMTAGGIFFSLSRTNFVVAIVVTLVSIVLHLVLEKPKITAVMAGVAVIVVSTASVSVIFAEEIDQALASWHERFDSMDDNLRWAYNRGAWELISRHPLTGVGLNNFPVDFQTTREGRHAEHDYNPHNSYLGMWSELGFPGLIIFCGIVFWPLYSFVKMFPRIKRSTEPTLRQLYIGGMGLSLVLVQSIFSYNFVQDFYYWIAFSFAALMVIALKRELRNAF